MLHMQLTSRLNRASACTCALPRHTCTGNTSSVHRHHVHMTQKKRAQVSGESERDTLESSSRDGCCLGEGSALTPLSIFGPDRLRSAPSTQVTAPSCCCCPTVFHVHGVHAMSTKETNKAHVPWGHRVPPTRRACYARTICSYLTGRRRDWSGGSRRRPLLCSWQPCIVTGCGQGNGGRGWRRQPSWCVPVVVCAMCRSPLHMRRHDGGKRTGPSKNRRESVAPSCESHVRRDSDRMMLVFSADQTTNLSAIPNCSPVAGASSDCKSRRLRPLTVHLNRSPFFNAPDRANALKGWHGKTSLP